MCGSLGWILKTKTNLHRLCKFIYENRYKGIKQDRREASKGSVGKKDLLHINSGRKLLIM